MSMTQRCRICQRELSIDKFTNQQNSKRKRTECMECALSRVRDRTKPGFEIKSLIKKEAGGCQNPDCCSANHGERLLVTNFNELMFQLDHIDESLKLHTMETKASWIACNKDEFFDRVKPNIQVLCYQCHQQKTSNAHRVGNKVHQKIHGRKPPSQFIDFGYNLFNIDKKNNMSVKQHDEVSGTQIIERSDYENGWFVYRDIYGYLIEYTELQDNECKGFRYNKDGERIS